MLTIALGMHVLVQTYVLTTHPNVDDTSLRAVHALQTHPTEP